MLLVVKPGVTPKNLVIAAAAANTADLLGTTVTITSGTDGHHMAGSKHYIGAALDFRLLDGLTQKFVNEMKRRLGDKDYDFVIEKDHIHIEYDPREK